MMRTGRVDRLWALGGVLSAAALLAIGWFFLISPQNARTSSLHDETATAQSRAAALQRRLGELRQQNGDLPRYRARLEADRQALPTTSDLSDFLRGVQSVGDSTGVSVQLLTVGAATQVTAADTKVYALPISLTATGATEKVDRFLAQLQQGQPRAVLIGNANLTWKDQSGSVAGSVDLQLSLQVFVAPPAGTAKAPSAPASPMPSPAASLAVN
jgi:Tfp pilus assembly protein PilO